MILRCFSLLTLIILCVTGHSAEPVPARPFVSLRFKPLVDQLVAGDLFFMEVDVTNVSDSEITVSVPSLGDNITVVVSAIYQDDRERGKFFGVHQRNSSQSDKRSSTKKIRLRAGETKRQILLTNVWTSENIRWLGESGSSAVTAALHFEPCGDYKDCVLDFKPFQRRFKVVTSVLDRSVLSAIAAVTIPNSRSFWFSDRLQERLAPLQQKTQFQDEIRMSPSDSLIKKHLVYQQSLQDLIDQNASESRIASKVQEFSKSNVPELRGWYSRCLATEVENLQSDQIE